MLQPHLGHLAVRFRPGLSAARKREVAAGCHLDRYRPRHELPGESFALIPLRDGADRPGARHAAALGALERHRHVVRAARVFRHGRTLVVATERIWVGVRNPAGLRAVEAFVRRRNGRLLERRGDDLLFRLRAADDPATVCRQLARLRTVAYAEPDHVLVGPAAAAVGARAAGPVQEALRIIGMPEAWRIQPIGRDVRVAVIDCGVLGSHPDLRGTIVGRFDATRHGNPLRPPPWDSHGTECAGLVAGCGRGAKRFRGVAAGCGILVARIGRTPTRLGDYISKVSWFVAGLDWAWKQGADVMSMSFGGGPKATPIVNALARARRLGRGGRGSVLVAAVGNSGTAAVEFPASDPGVIGVASTDRHGKPASFSNRGPAVDLAAPGVNVTTTTIPDPTEGERSWYLTDSGTSLSTPMVAGAAALLVAANPDLGERSIRQILAATALGRRSDRVGAGRLDVPKAIRRARAG